jgi:hypothetical protein
MQTTAAINSEAKALLALLLLKAGTGSPEIHNALRIAAASRIMIAKEHANRRRPQSAEATASNAAGLRPANAGNIGRRARYEAEHRRDDLGCQGVADTPPAQE